jgi:hypothetical protein
MVQLNQDEILIFGGEFRGNAECTSSCFILNKKFGVQVREGPRLPVACTSATSSYALNCTSFHYFMNEVGFIFRLNKSDLVWTQWKSK